MRNVRRIAVSAITAVLIMGCAQPQEIGKSHYAAKNYPAAIEAYKQANAEEPNKAVNAKGLADAYFANRQYNEAIEWYLKTKSLNPSDTSIACNLGTAYYYTGRNNEALAVLEAANIDPLAQNSAGRDARIRSFRGMAAPTSACAQTLDTLYEKTGRYDIAIATMKRKIDADPRQPEPFIKLSSLYFKNGQYDDAIIAAKRGIDLSPASAEAHHNLGVSYWKKKQYVQAVGSLRHALALNPKNSVTAVFLAKSYEQVEEEVKAVETLRYSRTSAPSAAVDFELARLLYRSGSYAESVELLNGVVEKNAITGIGIEFEALGGNPSILKVEKNSPAERAGLRVGDQMTQADQQNLIGLSSEEVSQKLRGMVNTPVTLTYVRGGETFQKQLMRETFFTASSAPMLALRALVYRKVGNLQKAQEDARRAYELDPKEGAMAMAAVAFEREDMAGTLRYASPLKGDIHARILEASVYALGGNSMKALELLRDVAVQGTDARNVPLQEDRRILLKALSDIAKERYLKGSELESSGQNGAALGAYADALLLSEDEAQAGTVRSAMFKLANASNVSLPEEAHRHIVRGEFFVGEGNFQEALSEFKKALVSAPYTSRLYFNLALVEAKLERYGDALRYMGLYLEASPDAPDARAAKDEMIKWEILMNKPREYSYYEGSGEGTPSDAGALPPPPVGGRGGMPAR